MRKLSGLLLMLAFAVTACGCRQSDDDSDSAAPDVAPADVQLGTEADAPGVEAEPPADGDNKEQDDKDDAKDTKPDADKSGSLKRSAAQRIFAIQPNRTLTIDQLVAQLGQSETFNVSSGELAALGQQAVPDLARALQEDDAKLRYGAVFTLSRLGKDAGSALPVLKQLSTNDQDELVRVAAMFAIDAVEGR